MRRGYGIYREVNKHHEQQHAHARVVYVREAGMCGTLKQVEDGRRSMWRTGVGAIMAGILIVKIFKSNSDVERKIKKGKEKKRKVNNQKYYMKNKVNDTFIGLNLCQKWV